MGRLFWKSFFAFWLALLVAGVGVGSAVWLHRQAEGEAAVALGPRGGFVVNAAASTLRHGGTPALRELMGDWGRGRGAARVLVVDEAGNDLLGRPVPPEALAQARALAASDQEPRLARRVRASDGGEFLVFIPPDALPPGRMAPRRDPPSPWVPIVIGILASLGFSALLAWYLSKPIRNLRWAFGSLSQGRLETRVAPLMGRRRDEVADLGQDFDRMAQQLQQLVVAQRRLLHDVSHELRSPLARLQAAIGLARQNPHKLEVTLERIERETMRVDELVGELLALSRLEAGTGGEPRERVDLMDLLASIADDARFEAQAGGRDLAFEGQGEAMAEVRAEPLHRAFENVIRNAVKYTRDGTTVQVRAACSQARDAFLVTVADRGPGVPEADLERIFEPFYRAENGRALPGFGLGLAIARRALQAHGGSVRAANRAGGGLEVTMELPLTGPGESR